jgi:hypothetical protein
MGRKRLVSMLAIAASAGALLAGGCASAATKAPTAGGTSAAKAPTAGGPAGPQASTARGPVQITGYSGNDGPKSTVVLTGAIGDFGEALRTYPNGTGKREYNQLDVAVTHGSFRLGIAGIESNLVSAFKYFPSNTSTCSGIVTATGMTPIVAGSGTGAYRGISGNFTMTITIHEVDSWPKCKALLAQTIFITGSGTVSFS